MNDKTFSLSPEEAKTIAPILLSWYWNNAEGAIENKILYNLIKRLKEYNNG